jgi:hypothetical protein
MIAKGGKCVAAGGGIMLQLMAVNVAPPRADVHGSSNNFMPAG